MTERAKCFADMRALARRVTQLWGERREEQGYPLGTVTQPAEATPCAPEPAALPPKGGSAPFVLEIGSEELPPADVESAMAQLRAAVPALLAELRLAHGGVAVEGTPRRLVVSVAGLTAFTEDVEERLRGPPAKAAFKDGAPTKALEGFARKNGVDPADVVVEADAKGVEYCYATVATPGRPAAEALAAALGDLVRGLSFKKSMRWNGALAYSRPLRWVLAMHGAATVPLAVGDLTGGATTRLLRNAAETEATLADAGEYGNVMRAAGIQVTADHPSNPHHPAKSESACGRNHRLCCTYERLRGINTAAKEDLLHPPEVELRRKHCGTTASVLTGCTRAQSEACNKGYYRCAGMRGFRVPPELCATFHVPCSGALQCCSVCTATICPVVLRQRL